MENLPSTSIPLHTYMFVLVFALVTDCYNMYFYNLISIYFFRQRKTGDFLRISAVRGARIVPRPALRWSSSRRVVAGRAAVLYDYGHDAVSWGQHDCAQEVHTGWTGGHALVDVSTVEIAHR